MFKYSKKIIAIMTLTLWTSVAVAADKLPEIIVGQTTVTSNSSIGSLQLFSATGYAQIDDAMLSTLGNSPFSVTAWIKPTDKNSSYQNIIGQGRAVSTSGNYTGWAIGLKKDSTGNFFQVQVSVGQSSTRQVLNSSDLIPTNSLFDDNWHFVAFTFSPSNLTPLQIKLDSHNNTGETYTTTVGGVANTAKVRIGNSLGVAGCSGLYDEVRIYNDIALNWTSLNILADQSKAAENTVSTANLIARWDFHEGSGTAINDVAGSYDGALKSGGNWGADVNSVSSTVYGGFTGNEAVYNYNQSGQDVGKNLGPSPVFNGTSSYIHASPDGNITGKTDFTISLWIKRAATASAEDEVIYSQAKGGYGDLNISIDNTSSNSAYVNTVKFEVGGTNGNTVTSPGFTNFNTRSTKKIYPGDNTWHNIVAIRKNDGLTGQLWIDGRLENEVSAITNVANNSCTAWNGATLVGSDCIVYLKTLVPFEDYDDGLGTSNRNIYTDIGKRSWKDSGDQRLYYFGGNISSIRTYTRDLTMAEIRNNIMLETGVPTDGLKSYWKLNEGGNSVNSTVNGYTALFFGAAWSEDGPVFQQTGDQEMFGFDKDSLEGLTGCITGALIGNVKPYAACFKPNSAKSGIKVIPSRTSVNGAPVLETAVLMYPQKTVMGDVYGALDNNFAFWGKNLHEANGTAGADASWTMDNYLMNTNAQAKWNSEEFQKNTKKIATLKGEAPVVNSDIGSGRSDWQLLTPTSTASSTMLTGNTAAEAAKNPEGKIWRVDGNLTINNLGVFSGKGTIIVNGNLTINKDITPASTGDNRLGFIVLGTATVPPVVTINNSKVQASIYCPGTITVGTGNSTLIGSFVANIFNLNSTNTRFYYDYALDNSWPPGFRFLNMPHPNETKQ